MTRNFLVLSLFSLIVAACAADGSPEVGDQCSDGADNDADGHYDCDDSDCSEDPACLGQGDDDDSSPSDDDDSALPEVYVGDLTLATGAAMDWFCASWDRIDGSLTVTVQQEPNLDALSCLREVTGDLRISSPSLETLSLPALNVLLGTLIVRQNDQLLSLQLPALTSIGALELSSNTLLTDLSGLGSLEEVIGSVDVFSNQALQELSWGALDEVQGPVVIRSNPSLQRVYLDALQSVGGGLSVTFQDALLELRLPSLVTVTGDLRVSSNDLLDALAITQLSSVGDSVYVGNNLTLGSLLLPQLSSVGSLRISSNPSLPTVQLGALTLIAGDLHIAVNNSLPQLNMPFLMTVQGDFYVGSNASLASFGFSALQSVSGEFRVTHNQSLATSLIQSVIDALGLGLGGPVVLDGNAPG